MLKEILARERERKARTSLLMSIPEDHLAKFHKITDAKEMWEDIKSRFGGNDESKKMQKYILKQQFESFSVSNSEGLHKGYDRFQSLLSQLEIHGAGVSTEDANQKFLRSKGNQESRRRDAGNTEYKAKDNRRRPGKQEEPKALVTLDGDGVDWTGHAEDEQKNFALMAHSNSGSNTKVTSCSKECEESYAKLKKLYDGTKGSQLGVASIEIQAYTQALKKMSTKDKSGLGYGNQIHEGVLSYEKEVLESVFDNRSSDVEDSHVNDRFAKVEGMHAVPPPMTRIYMPSKSDFGIDDVETPDFVPKPTVNEPTTVNKLKVWFDAPIIEEYESDSDDEYVIEPSKEQEKPSFAFVNTVKHVKTPRETVKAKCTCSSFGWHRLKTLHMDIILSSVHGSSILDAQRSREIGFPAQSVGSSNTDVLDSPCLLVLITETSQSRQHVTYQELVCGWLKQDFHLHCEYLSITRMFWQDLKDNA
ncbi:hypothetical protein Tco_0902740 [Tanacetum coccineum]